MKNIKAKDMTEEWRKVPGIPLLWASNTGKVKSEARDRITTRVRNGKSQTFNVSYPEKILSQHKERNGYLYVASIIKNTRKKYLVHRLIGMAFVDGYSSELTINHLDGNKLNNSIENLEWATLYENTSHQWRTGLVNLRGENHPSSKLTYQKVKIIREMIAKGVSCNAIGVLANINPTIIYRIRDGSAWNDITA